MKTKSKAEIRENERKKIKKQFEQKYDDLIRNHDYYKSQYGITYEAYCKEQFKNKQLRNEVDKLKEENEQLKDWIERLQEFVDMTDDQRSEAVKTYIESTKNKAKINELLGTYTRIFSTLFQ